MCVPAREKGFSFKALIECICVCMCVCLREVGRVKEIESVSIICMFVHGEHQCMERIIVE